MHGPLRDNLTLKYGECKSCSKRSQFACVRCACAGSVIGNKSPLLKAILILLDIIMSSFDKLIRSNLLLFFPIVAYLTDLSFLSAA
jgi:hypothetical protein